MRPSSVKRSTLYSSELRFLISSRVASNSCRASNSCSVKSSSIVSRISNISFLCAAKLRSISARSEPNSSRSSCRSFSNSNSELRSRELCRSMSLSTMSRCARSAIWYCSSESSRSRSRTWMMASFRSTSRSWFCDMISISLRRSSTLTSRISFRHCVRILSRLIREYFSSASCRSLSSRLRPSSFARAASSSFMRSISKRSCRSCADSGPLPFLSTTLEPPFMAFLIFAMAAPDYAGSRRRGSGLRSLVP
mmetsp:Transcript_5178/g.13620  ORF Transcript_5178/g.13620 Transcript_5178/m.13620 type:complete len:251 (-) Transcript_5178:22-774(-)